MTNTKMNLANDSALSKIIQVDFANYREAEDAAIYPEFSSSAKLYDASSLPLIDWPDTPEATLVRNYFTPLIERGTKHFYSNIEGEIRLLKINEHVLPILIVDDRTTNSYVCSPHTHYISLALESTQQFKSRALRGFANIALKGFGKILKLGAINRIVYVNHWLQSTDLHPKHLTAPEIASITELLKGQFPSHAIAFRSINERSTPTLKSNLKENNYKPIATRQIFLTNTSDKSLFSTRIIKSDLKLWNESHYQILQQHEITPNDFPRILELYNIVSLEHHSEHNPKLNEELVAHMLQTGLLKIQALKQDGIIQGVAGYIIKEGLFISPFFGYDKDHQDKNRIYRTLSTLLLLEASKSGLLFHQSAGASFYKTIRRAASYQEYIAVNPSHLRLSQKFSWNLLRIVMNTAGVAFMRKY